MKHVPDDVWEMVSLARYADEHVLPIAGGILDQTESFRHFLRAWRDAKNEIKASMTSGE